MMHQICILCKGAALRAAAVVGIPVALIRALRMYIIPLLLLSGLLTAALLLLAGLLTGVLVLLTRLVLLLLVVHLVHPWFRCGKINQSANSECVPPKPCEMACDNRRERPSIRYFGARRPYGLISRVRLPQTRLLGLREASGRRCQRSTPTEMLRPVS